MKLPVFILFVSIISWSCIFFCVRFSKVSNRESQKNVSQWVTDLRKVTGEIPIVVVGNKVDLPERVVKACRVGPGRIWRSHMESRMEFGANSHAGAGRLNDDAEVEGTEVRHLRGWGLHWVYIRFLTLQRLGDIWWPCKQVQYYDISVHLELQIEPASIFLGYKMSVLKLKPLEKAWDHDGSCIR